MPPVTKAGNDQFRKDVRFLTKDDEEDEQVAAGIVMVPDKADLQRDFAREETIREFADQFGAFVEADQAGGGVMHAVWPDGWMALERNEVLDEGEEIGGTTVDAGAWVQEWSIENDDLWALIDDGILAGYSIGAIQVDWTGPYEQDEDDVDDVDTSEVPDDELVWELTDGIIREVSAVDIPAVPDAQILEAKDADHEKALGSYLGDRDGFLEEAMERGHSEPEAERLWDVLNDAVEAEGSDEPGKQTVLARIGKAALDAVPGFGDSLATRDGDDPDGAAKASAATKAGQTLSQDNRESAMAAVDANLDMLEDAGVDHGLTRFTDQEGVDFDLSEHQAREWGGGHGDSSGDNPEDEEEQPIENAAGGDTPDDTGGSTKDATDDMSNDDNPMEDAPEWAKTLHDDIQENSKRIDEALERQRPKTAEIEIGGETYEVPEDAAKAALGVDEDAGVGVGDAIEELKAQVDDVQGRVDTIARQSGGSDQIRSGVGDDEAEKESGLDALGGALS